MELYYLILLFLLMLTLMFFFFLFGKIEKYENYLMTIFECGFSSYFFSRFSFSIQFFLIALIFLFFDLELCCLMPFFQESQSNIKNIQMAFFFVLILLIGLIKEIKDYKLDWMN